MEQNHQPKMIKNKKSHIAEVVVSIGVVLSLVIGFLSGYSIANHRLDKQPQVDQSIYDEALEILKNTWLDVENRDINYDALSIQGLLNELNDPYSDYYTKDEWASYTSNVNGSVIGIGVSLRVVEQGGLITAVSEGSPAKASGLVAGDIMTHVDGQSIQGMSATEIAKLIQGEEGVAVKIRYLHDDTVKEVDIVRRQIDGSCMYTIKEEQGHRFGYIQISTFGQMTAQRFKEALDMFKEADIKTLVIDLRNNTGGYLSAAEGILNLLLPKGQIMYYLEERGKEAIAYRSDNADFYHFDQGYILVNDYSASASEVVAGALQEVLKYQLVGEKTYGKGTAQINETLSDLSVLKYTYARWLLPSGKCIHGEGLTPDIEVEQINTDDITTRSLEHDLAYDSVDSLTISLQKMLNMLGYGSLREDGYFDRDTENALKQFEQEQQLKIDGIYSNDDHDQLVVQVLLYLSEHDMTYQKLLDSLE